jgi:mRNA-degrading endonuclease RelE of RelBE toxin-antitoxin system
MVTVEFTKRCLDHDFEGIPENIERGLLRKLETLQYEPLFGKALVGPLARYRSVTFGQYRALYRYHVESDTTFVVIVGVRKGHEIDDVYQMAQQLLRAGRLDATAAQLTKALEHNMERLRSMAEKEPKDKKGRDR